MKKWPKTLPQIEILFANSSRRVCLHCNKSISNGFHYVSGAGDRVNMHLTCFKDFISRGFVGFSKENLKMVLLPLKPYKKEMICETLNKK